MFPTAARIQGALQVLQHQGPQFLGAHNFRKCRSFCYMQFVKYTMPQQTYLLICHCWTSDRHSNNNNNNNNTTIYKAP